MTGASVASSGAATNPGTCAGQAPGAPVEPFNRRPAWMLAEPPKSRSLALNRTALGLPRPQSTMRRG